MPRPTAIATGAPRRVTPDCGEPPQSSAELDSAGNANAASTPLSGLYHDSTTFTSTTVVTENTNGNDGNIPLSEPAGTMAGAAHTSLRGETEGAGGPSREGTYGIAPTAEREDPNELLNAAGGTEPAGMSQQHLAMDRDEAFDGQTVHPSAPMVPPPNEPSETAEISPNASGLTTETPPNEPNMPGQLAGQTVGTMQNAISNAVQSPDEPDWLSSAARQLSAEPSTARQRLQDASQHSSTDTVPGLQTGQHRISLAQPACNSAGREYRPRAVRTSS